jgi:hypothetical protein
MESMGDLETLVIVRLIKLEIFALFTAGKKVSIERGKPMCIRAYLSLLLFTLLAWPAAGQDFIMQGCYWSCPGDSPQAPIDSATLRFWIERMEKQAPELSHSGFSFLWLPSIHPSSPPELQQLLRSLERSGIRPIAELDLGEDSLSLPQQARALNRQFNLNAFSLSAKRSLDAAAAANEINQLVQQGKRPQFLAANLPFHEDPRRLGEWAAEVLKKLSPQAQREIDPRIYDVSLRETLRRACADTTFDVRQVFERSIRDASALSGFNIITLVNHPAYKNQNGKAGDWDDPLADPLLAYAYIIANNQIGLPTIYYGDYYGAESELDGFLDKKPLKAPIDQLIKAHQDYIFNSVSIEYLNRLNTDRASHYHSGSNRRALVFQIDGSATAAGKSNLPPGNKDVLAAINFSGDTLRALFEINMSNVVLGDVFTDVLGSSLSPEMRVMALDSAHRIPNAVQVVLPPRSYALWVQGRASPVVPSRVSLFAAAQVDFVELNWEVAYESNTLGYELERSVNGRDFIKVASFRSLDAGVQSASYLHIDKDVFPGEELRYRVKLINREGGYEYSPTAKARLRKPELSFELVEDNRQSEKVVRVRSNYDAQADLAVFSAKGQKVIARREVIRKGENMVKLDLSGLAAGVYVVHFTTSAGKEWTQRIVKQ